MVNSAMPIARFHITINPAIVKTNYPVRKDSFQLCAPRSCLSVLNARYSTGTVISPQIPSGPANGLSTGGTRIHALIDLDWFSRVTVLTRFIGTLARGGSSASACIDYTTPVLGSGDGEFFSPSQILAE